MSADAPASAQRPPLLLYGRRYCHLCDDMLAALRALRGVPAIDIRYIDVDGDPALERRFGEFVPVLMAGETELCRYRLDEAAVRAHLRKIG